MERPIEMKINAESDAAPGQFVSLREVFVCWKGLKIEKCCEIY